LAILIILLNCFATPLTLEKSIIPTLPAANSAYVS
jgi:hypothetical protein